MTLYCVENIEYKLNPSEWHPICVLTLTPFMNGS